MGLLDWFGDRKTRQRRRTRQERESAIVRDTIAAASVRAQAESIVGDIRQNLDRLDGVLGAMKEEETP